MFAFCQSLDDDDEDDNTDSQSAVSVSNEKSSYNYLLSLPLWSLTKEKKDELLKQRDAKAEELYELRRKSPPDLWRIDLNALLEELDVGYEGNRCQAIVGQILDVACLKQNKDDFWSDCSQYIWCHHGNEKNK